jgi:hypothetical protein
MKLSLIFLAHNQEASIAPTVEATSGRARDRVPSKLW